MDHRLLFGIEDGEDLILTYRAADELQEELLTLAGGRGAEWSHDRNRTQAQWLAAVSAGIAVALYSEFQLADVVHRFSDGFCTAEICIAFYAALAAILVGVVAIAWLPSRIRIDRLGVERTRGFLGLFTFHVPADRVELVVTQHSMPGFESMLIFDQKVHIGSLRRTRGALAAKFRGRSGRNLAMRLSERLAALLDARHRNLTH